MDQVDVNKPQENPKLKALFIQKKAAKSDEEFDGVMNELCGEIVMNAHFLSVVKFSKEPESKGSNQVVVTKGTQIAFPMLSTQDNRKFYPAFIDWDELNKWNIMKDTKPKTLILSFDDYAAMVLDSNGGDGFVINPFSDNLILDRKIINHLREKKHSIKSGITECQAKKDTKVIIGEPKEYPSAMTDAICTYAKTDKRIHSIWLKLMERDEKFSYLLVVDFQGDEPKSVFSKIGEAAQPFLNGKYLDMVPLSEQFGADAVKGAEPFYKKKKGFFSK